MSYKLIWVAGPERVEDLPLMHGLKIGRRKGDLLLPDEQVSGQHAAIEKDENRFKIIDLDSKNGLYVNSRRVTTQQLDAGDIITIGSFQFRVELEIHPPATQEDTTEDPIITLLERLSSNTKDEIQPIQVPQQKWRILAKEGIQTDQEWILGYLPRAVGFLNLDICLYETNSPVEAFLLQYDNTDKELIFFTKFPDVVKYCGKSVSTSRIKVGDWIKIGETKLTFEIDA